MFSFFSDGLFPQSEWYIESILLSVSGWLGFEFNLTLSLFRSLAVVFCFAI